MGGVCKVKLALSVDCLVWGTGDGLRHNGDSLSSPVLVLGNADFLRMNPSRASDPPAGTPRECPQVRKPVCAGPSKGSLGFQSPSFSPTWLESPLVFTVSYWNRLFPGLGPWAGEPPNETRNPFSFRGATAASLYLPVFLHYPQVQVQLYSQICPYQLRCGSLILSDVGVTINWTSIDSPC